MKSKETHPTPISLPYNLKNLISLTVALKICLILAVIVGAHLLIFNRALYDINNNALFKIDANFDRFQQLGLPVAFQTWDSQHYIFLAERGYLKEARVVQNKYPLYPFLIQKFNFIFLNNTWLCGLVLSNLFSLVAIIFLFLFVEKLFDSKTAFITSILFLSFPTAFYMSLVYAEGLFLMLVFIFFYSLYERKHFIAFIVAFLLPLTRAQGIWMIIPLIVFIISRLIGKDKNHKKILWDFLLVFAFIGGLLVYLIFLKSVTGSYLAAFQDKYYVSHPSIWNIFDLHGWFMRNFVNLKLDFHSYTTSIIDRLFFCFFLIISFFTYKDLDKTLFTFGVVFFLIPALMDSFMSYTRYVLLAFPFFIVLAKRLNDKYLYLALLMFSIQIVFLIAHCLNYWIS